MGRFVLRNALQILIGSGIFVVFALLMIPRISREVNMVDYFKKDSEIRQAEEMMEKKLGGSIPVQILVKGDLKDPFVLKEMLKFEKFLDARPNIHDPQSIADLICEMNWVMNGHRTIPETREGVANLCFFIEGNEVLDQLITNDGTEALIQAKLGTVNTKEVLALVSAVEEYINSELRTDLITVEYSLASPELAEELAKERTERILTQIGLDIDKRGLGWNENNRELRDLVATAVVADTGAFGDTLINSIAVKIEKYLRSEDADIQIKSEKIIAAIVADIGDAMHSGSPNEDNIVAILKKDIPKALYADDPEALDYAAETIVALITDEAKWAKTNRLVQEIKPFLPETLRDDDKFHDDLRDDVWEINEDWTAIASSKYKRLSGKKGVESQTELSARQTGMPIIYMDLDKKIMRSQAFSLSIAIFLVFILLAYRLKSLIGGLISITPIILTILFNFAIMATFRIPLDVVTVLIGSVAVGIGIDYTIHFITRFKVEHARGKTKLEALDKTLETTGKAIVINALSVMMGFLVLILGNIVPMQRFGYLIALTMVISALASITVLPALLLITRAGFVGRLDSMTNGMVSKAKGKVKKIINEM